MKPFLFYISTCTALLSASLLLGQRGFLWPLLGMFVATCAVIGIVVRGTRVK